MESKKEFYRKLYIALYYIIVVVSLFIVIAMAILESRTGESLLKDFSNGWRSENYEIVNLVSTYRGIHIVRKVLDCDLEAGDSLCFESHNSNIRVIIGGINVYDFKSKQNFTGMGYGYAFHFVQLSRENEGKEVAILFSPSVTGTNDGSVMKVFIGKKEDYFHKVFSGMNTSFALSLLILFFGILLLFIQFTIGADSIMPFSMSSLAAISIDLGLWAIADTNIIQLMTGRIYTARFLYVVLPFLGVYPIICFVNSLTNNKRLIYRHIAFGISVMFLFLIPLLRFGFNIDLAKVFVPMAAAEIIITLLYIAVIIIDDWMFCRSKSIRMGINNIIPGMLVLVVCGTVDVVSYLFGIRISDNASFFTRIGLIIFIFILMARFFKWWTKDKRAVERDRFINRALQYAVASNSPDENIRAMIGFLGTEMDAKRLFVFEDQKNGKYRGTYEWYREGEESASIDLMYFPYEGFVDRLYDIFNSNDHRLIIENPNEYKELFAPLYSTFMTNDIENMILSPLEVGGHIFGICGIVNAPQKALSIQADIINLVSYFLAQMILQREEQERSYFYNYNDVLSGAGNYMAYRKFTESELDTSEAFGYLRCDLLNLDEINVIQGYEVGDQIVVLAARNLMDVFGEKNVFRMNGTQFTAFGFETDEIFFNNNVEKLKKLMKENGIEASVASVYCIYGTTDFGLVTKRVDDLIHGAESNKE